MEPTPSHEAEPSPSGDLPFYVLAVLVGAITGVIGTLLHVAVDAALRWPAALQRALDDGIAWPQGLSLVGAGIDALLAGPRALQRLLGGAGHVDLGASGGVAVLAAGLIAAVLVVLSVMIVRAFAPEAGGSGVQEIEGAMEGRRPVRWRRILPVKFFGGLLALGSGLVAGREGPTIHMGSSIAAAASETFGVRGRDGRGLLAAGAAAGLAAAFSAPLASILFVIEETRRQFPYCVKTYSGVMLAAVASGVVTEAMTGRQPFMLVDVPQMPLGLLPAFAGLGVLLGVVGVVFNRVLVWSMDAALGVGRHVSFYLVPAVVGFAVGVLLMVLPEATMGGETLAVSLMRENLPLTTLAIVVLVRFVMTMASYATGAPGGIFAPILALATAIGLLYGLVLDLGVTLPPGALPAFAVAAMGGLFSATVRAPLVGVVLIAELTGDYGAFVPAIVTCLFANLVADRLGGRPIYEVLLERTLRLAGDAPAAAADARKTRQLGGWDQR
ncbi:H(+)/Cl(-) exchange transporter ClcA [Acuticoccus sp. I52.16.1]|uniref:H(+)/Cl(-) exchange transporter ClcA n=1 Tax=Acuticoccus sp. I52.16.1 TaxID=2928472 RepID=UPI001FD2958A|nr:H(+)/Cl(-) exchange transporter ClcA [Acuticoccus sp. I52.16.1]UOM37295.1 H(+)/Cl(-) exchange transporter ClcA [Acuticoccus sp. I52.16.1]